MGVNGELPKRPNRRGGAGWWMDVDGVWRPPEEWPEDSPPVEGWVRTSAGGWQPPTLAEPDSVAPRVERAPTIVAERQETHTTGRSRQAQADRRAVLLVVGALGGAALLLVAALILITQASASGNGDETAPPPEVIYAAETDQVRAAQRRSAALDAPASAIELLASLPSRPANGAPDPALIDTAAWDVVEADCLDRAEQVLVDRSVAPVTWADQLECVPDEGLWFDRYLGQEINRTIDAEVGLLIPPAVAYASGGASWALETKQAFVLDTDHPATLHIVSAGSGHNPRQQDPSSWKPSNRASWCAYAVDWVAVKHRWSLDVTSAERIALTEMLETCGEPTSDGADPASMVLEAPAAPTITLSDAAG